MADFSQEDKSRIALAKAILETRNTDANDLSPSLQAAATNGTCEHSLIATQVPINLYLIAQDGQGAFYFVWDRPVGCGQVSNYLVERRQIQQNGEYGGWTVIGNAYLSEIELTGQPVGVKLEYRVKAVAVNGETLNSNHISV